jgi:hypothetical protein
MNVRYLIFEKTGCGTQIEFFVHFLGVLRARNFFSASRVMPLGNFSLALAPYTFHLKLFLTIMYSLLFHN